jgi:hypothetical protein
VLQTNNKRTSAAAALQHEAAPSFLLFFRPTTRVSQIIAEKGIVFGFGAEKLKRPLAIHSSNTTIR